MQFIRWWRNRQCPPAPESSAAAMQAAADAGNAEAQFQLGVQLGVDQPGRNLPEAARWYEKAARQGHTMAQYNLAVMLGRGQGVSRDDAAALAWTRRAAEGGDAAAQFLLGRRLHRTSLDRLAGNCGESLIEAYKWFRLAADQGYTGSREACDEMTLHMTHDDVADGNRRVAGFVPRATSVPDITGTLPN